MSVSLATRSIPELPVFRPVEFVEILKVKLGIKLGVIKKVTCYWEGNGTHSLRKEQGEITSL